MFETFLEVGHRAIGIQVENLTHYDHCWLQRLAEYLPRFLVQHLVALPRPPCGTILAREPIRLLVPPLLQGIVWASLRLVQVVVDLPRVLCEEVSVVGRAVTSARER